MKKYELVGETVEHSGRILHRIRRLSDGVMGGWIEKEANLSQEGGCWVGGNSMVYGNARVTENAQVRGHAAVFGDARISGNAKIGGDAQISGNVQVFQNALIYENAQVSGNVKVFENACVFGIARICGDRQVGGNTWITKPSQVSAFELLVQELNLSDKEKAVKKYEFTGKSINYLGRTLFQIRRLSDGVLGGYVEGEKNLSHKGNCWIFDDAKVFDSVQIKEDVQVSGNAVLFDGEKSEVSSSKRKITVQLDMSYSRPSSRYYRLETRGETLLEAARGAWIYETNRDNFVFSRYPLDEAPMDVIERASKVLSMLY